MINPLFQLIAASGTLFAVTLGREVVQGFLSRLLSGRILQAMGFLFPIGLAVALGGQWVLGRFGQPANGVVQSKREAIEVQRDGSWSRVTELVARYNAGKQNGALEVTVPVSPEVYDVAPVGRVVPLRCMPLYQTLCLLKYDSVAEWEARRLLALATGRESMFLLGLGLAVFWLGFAEWDASKPGQRWLGRLLFASWSITLLYLTGRPNLPISPQGNLVRGQARVTGVRPFSSYEFLQPLAIRYTHPFAVVQLALVPAPGRDPVIAVDAVDQSAASGFRVGAVVPVLAPAGDPRAARLADGTRAFARGNVPRELSLTALLLTLVVGPVILVELLRRRSAG
jgi:hypothetical protein